MQLVLVLLVATLAIYQLTVTGAVNWGSLLFVRAIANSEPSAGTYPYPHWKVHPESMLLSQTRKSYEIALRLAPSSTAARWGYGRVALALGEAEKAVSALPIDSPDLPTNPVRFLDTLTAHSKVNKAEDVLTLEQEYAVSFPGRIISDTIALEYLNRAKAKIEADNLSEAVLDLHQVIQFRPFDLYALYYLRQHAIQEDVPGLVDAYTQQLLYFPADAVTVGDERFLDYAFEILPGLTDETWWGEERLRNLIAYWVWNYPNHEGLGTLLQELTTQFTTEAAWPFYLGELFHRLGKLDIAQTYYRQALEIDERYISAQERLHQLSAEPKSKNEVATDEESSQDREIVAGLLGLSVDDVHLGENLLSGEMLVADTRVLPPDWLLRITGAGVDQEPWAFVVGRDPLERTGNVRIANLWWPLTDTESGWTAYADYWYWGEPVATYPDRFLVSLWFKLDAESTSTNRGLVYMNELGTVDDAFPLTFLPDTAGHWSRLDIVGARSQSPSTLLPILRNFGAANIWFQDITVRPLELSSATDRCVDTPCISISTIPN